MHVLQIDPFPFPSSSPPIPFFLTLLIPSPFPPYHPYLVPSLYFPWTSLSYLLTLLVIAATMLAILYIRVPFLSSLPPFILLSLSLSLPPYLHSLHASPSFSILLSCPFSLSPSLPPSFFLLSLSQCLGASMTAVGVTTIVQLASHSFFIYTAASAIFIAAGGLKMFFGIYSGLSRFAKRMLLALVSRGLCVCMYIIMHACARWCMYTHTCSIY